MLLEYAQPSGISELELGSRSSNCRCDKPVNIKFDVILTVQRR